LLRFKSQGPTVALVCVIPALTPEKKIIYIYIAFYPAACEELIECFRFKHEFEELGEVVEKLLVCSGF